MVWVKSNSYSDETPRSGKHGQGNGIDETAARNVGTHDTR